MLGSFYTPSTQIDALKPEKWVQINILGCEWKSKRKKGKGIWDPLLWSETIKQRFFSNIHPLLSRKLWLPNITSLSSTFPIPLLPSLFLSQKPLWKSMIVTERRWQSLPEQCHPESLMSPLLYTAPGALPKCDFLPLIQPALSLATMVMCIVGCL